MTPNSIRDVIGVPSPEPRASARGSEGHGLAPARWQARLASVRERSLP
ncbi:MAG: hypothetical protein QOG59_2203, partial [Solirubrobacteraceae bacterium]|nr:hypothetical protein [Solirubrobacteraceae bacterium]